MLHYTLHTFIILTELFPNATVVLSLHIEPVFSQQATKGIHCDIQNHQVCILSFCVLTPVPSLLRYYQSPAPAPQVKHNRSINKEVLISMTASLSDLMCSCHLS